MSSYFPIPPDINIQEDQNNYIKSSITLAGFSNNSLLNKNKNNLKDKFYYSFLSFER